jgi:predicted PolB exonuclease-like 3'-5' exonuclease
MDRFALDIETIPLTNDPDFDDPTDWTVFAVALGHQTDASGAGDLDVAVLFRQTDSIGAENRLLQDVLDWIAERTRRGEPRELLTYNGSSYDLPILQERARRARRLDPRGNIVERLVLFFGSTDHVDLIQIMRAERGRWVSLDDALDMHGIVADEPCWMGEKITGADMPSMGRELIANRRPGVNEELREAVRRYASSDVAPLFELHDKIRGESPHRP